MGCTKKKEEHLVECVRLASFGRAAGNAGTGRGVVEASLVELLESLGASSCLGAADLDAASCLTGWEADATAEASNTVESHMLQVMVLQDTSCLLLLHQGASASASASTTVTSSAKKLHFPSSFLLYSVCFSLSRIWTWIYSLYLPRS